MTSTREQFEAQPKLNQALNEWSPEDGWLSAGQIALASTVHALVDHFDRLDGQYQTVIADALAAVAKETSASEEYVRAAMGAGRQHAPVFRLAEYTEVHGTAADVGIAGHGLEGETLHNIPRRPGSGNLWVFFHGSMKSDGLRLIDLPGNLIVIDDAANTVWLYREQVSRAEASSVIADGIAHAKKLGRPFEHTDMRPDFYGL